MILTVSELNEYVSNILFRDPMLRDINVEGEISGFKRHSSGHIYFSLKDNNALIRCIMFKSAAYDLSFRPADGMKVTVGGHASLYTRDGQFQLYAQTMQKQGAGELFMRFLKLKEQLEREGYFDAGKKRPIPYLPRRVGVITSPTGAVLHDITQIIRRRFPAMDITVYPAPVQGDGAAQEIARGIRRMNELRAASVLIVCRGGGSIEDLWAFNERELVEAVYESEIPVVSAVGHETDYTLTDFAADKRAPTPSAAAELCVPEYDALLMRMDELHRRLAHAPLNGIRARRERLDNMLKHGLYECARGGLLKKRVEVEKLMLRLEARSVQSLLKSGYALITDADGALITSAAGLRKGEEYGLRMQDGSARAEITDINLGV